MEDNWRKYAKGTNLGCTAQDVTALSVEAKAHGECTLGDNVTVSLTAKYHFRTERYDPGFYSKYQNVARRLFLFHD